MVAPCAETGKPKAGADIWRKMKSLAVDRVSEKKYFTWNLNKVLRVYRTQDQMKVEEFPVEGM